jgi:hypothetical protein
MAANQAANDGVDVTRDNFEATLPSIKEALDECEFFAFDCEMTGLFLDGHKHEYLDDMQDRWVSSHPSQPHCCCHIDSLMPGQSHSTP